VKRRGTGAILAAFAAAGLVGAHVLAYAIALPDAAIRATILRGTGHGYLSAAGVVAVVAAIFGSFAAAWLGGRSQRSVPIGWRQAALRIAAVQTGAFVVLEVAERAAVNIPPVAINPRLLVVGIAVQLLVACLAAAVIALACRVGAIVWRALAGSLRASAGGSQRLVRVFEARAFAPALAGGYDSRAPPSTPH
jgi:hypothetical protein